MRIKQLEVSGFKSFLDKTKFEFNVPITTIVGPNGCGKSNVVDAIKWITGELSFKELRGRSMEDLIFAGSDKRPPTSMMEVMLTLDNEQKNAPAQYNEFNEITLQRRIFRDGTSEFYINKIPCRLRDINDLFLDTGMGQSSYSIIEQGKVGLIVSGRPEDRRLMIEEAAGITKYKSRKKAAERKIEYTKQNLLRVSDIILELKKQISSLERQAKKAEEFRKAQGKVQEIDMIVTGQDYRDLQAWSKDSMQNETHLQDNLSRVEADLSGHESTYETKRLELDAIEKDFQSSQQNLFAIRSNIQQITNQIETHQRDIARLQNDIAQGTSKDSFLSQEIAKARQKIQDTKDQIDQLETENKRLQESLSEKQTICSEHKTLVSNHEQTLEQSKAAHIGIVTKEAQINSSMTSARQQKESMDAEIVQLRSIEQELELDIQSKKDQFSAQKLSLDQASQLSFTFEESQKITKEKMGQFETSKNELESEISSIQKKLDSHTSKLHALQEFARTYQGYTKSVQGVMKNRDQFGHIHGVLGEIIKPHKGFEKTIQASLAELIECVLVDDANDVAKIVDYLKTEQKTRGLFLASNDLKIDTPRVKNEKIMGPLADFVDIQHASKTAIRNILNNIFVVNASFEEMFGIWKQNPHCQFVNLEGDFISTHGVIHAGPWSETRGDLEVRVQIEELQAEIEPLKATRDDLAIKLSQLIKTIHHTRHQLETIHTDMEKQTKISLDLSREFEKLQSSIELLEHKHTDAVQRREKLEQSAQALQQNIHAWTSEVQQLLTEKNEIEGNINRSNEALQTSRQEYQAHVDQLNEFQIRIASMQERAEGLRRDHENTKELLQYNSDEKDRNAAHIVQSGEEITKLEEEVKIHSQSKETGIVELRERETANANLQSKHDLANEEIRSVENRIKTVRTNKETTVQSLGEVRVKISEFSLRMENLQKQILERYNSDLLEYLATTTEQFAPEVIAEHRNELDSLKEKVVKFGNVNLAAIEEVDQLKERFEFLNNQRDDLEKSLQSLTEAIRKINRTTREKFETTFNEVNERFQQIFPRLFRGGKAKLTLTDPENVLETGVDIFAQPPGKKLQNMNLLSGGEKALTAISLLFAIFEYKAPPFCVLDEVDAPLDDANVLRFVSIVKEMSQKTQFIVITHNKNTMEMANNLYGVTMEEPGLSKVVSVRLHQDKVAENIEPVLEARSAAVA